MTDKTTIKSWSEEDRPREKLLLKGKESLSDAELMAILIGSGSRELTAVELCRSILRSASDNLHELSKWEVDDLIKYKGIGEAKAISIVSALELGRRKLLTDPLQRKVITCSHDAYNAIYPILADLQHEEFWVMYMNHGKKLLSKTRISQGGTSMTVVDVKMIMKKAINQLASSMIIVHNHPSGNLKPSQADISLTKKIYDGSKLLDIRLDDHLIISQNGYFSFSDEGMMP